MHIVLLYPSHSGQFFIENRNQAESSMTSEQAGDDVRKGAISV